MNKLVKIGTSGDVDNGKSSLIGRLFYDTESLPVDRLNELIEQSGSDQINLADITHGLKDERARGITIDVAHLYFSSGSSQFIIADCPGHTEYTSKMFTGTSVVDASLVLIDATSGITQQNRRHLAIAGILGVPDVIVCVNKMDLIQYEEGTFLSLKKELLELFTSFEGSKLHFIPMSALLGDNVVTESENMKWYNGSTVLDILEQINTTTSKLQDLRMIVQWVSGEQVSGHIDSGVLTVNDSVKILPTQYGIDALTQVKRISEQGQSKVDAEVDSVITIEIADKIDVKRGDIISHPEHLPIILSEFSADICWMDLARLDTERSYEFHVANQTVTGWIQQIYSKIDFDSSTLDAQGSVDAVMINDIAQIRVSLASNIVFEALKPRSDLGNFVVIDPETHRTVGAGLIRGSFC